MKAKQALLWTIWVIAGLIVLAAVGVFLIENNPSTIGRADRLQYYQLYLDVFKAILVGGFVALASLLIPAVIAQANADFSKLKESRIAYSKAKTGVDYLPIRLCSLDLARAGALLQQVHVHKHQAELYTELAQHLKRRNITESPQEWGNQLFEKLFACMNVLERNAEDWDTLQPHARLLLLLDALSDKMGPVPA